MLLHKFLIGRAHALPRVQSGLSELIGCTGSSHRLAHDIDLGIIHDRLNVMNNKSFILITREFSQIKDILNLNILFDPAGYECIIVLDHLENSASDCSVA